MSYKQHIMRPYFFFIPLITLLMGEFNLLTFKVIVAGRNVLLPFVHCFLSCNSFVHLFFSRCFLLHFLAYFSDIVQFLSLFPLISFCRYFFCGYYPAYKRYLLVIIVCANNLTSIVYKTSTLLFLSPYFMLFISQIISFLCCTTISIFL